MSRKPIDLSELMCQFIQKRQDWFVLCVVMCVSLLMASSSHAQATQAQAKEATQALRFVIAGDRSNSPLEITFENCISQVNEVDAVDLGLVPGIQAPSKPDRWDYAYRLARKAPFFRTGM